MKGFAHSADWHLGASANIIPNNLKRQEEVIEQIYHKSAKLDCKTIVVVGDALHRHNPIREERDLLLKLILKQEDAGFSTILLEGNHDKLESKYTNIHFLKMLQRRGRLKRTYVIENWPELIEVNGLSFLAIPKGNKDPNRIIKKYKDKQIIVLIHDEVRKAKYDSGYSTRRGLEFKLHPNVIYYAFGHLHTYQKLWQNGYYCGSPCQHNFGERGKKGFLMVDVQKPNEPQFIKVKSKRLLEVREGDAIPKDAWVRLISNKPTIDLPDNVVDVTPHKEKFKPIKLNLEDITEGLPEFLAKEGLSKKEQQKAVLFVKGLLEEN